MTFIADEAVTACQATNLSSYVCEKWDFIRITEAGLKTNKTMKYQSSLTRLKSKVFSEDEGSMQ